MKGDPSRTHLLVVARELQEGLLQVAFVRLEKGRVDPFAASARATRSPSSGGTAARITSPSMLAAIPASTSASRPASRS